MENFNVKEAAEQSLRLLEQSGASVKTLKEYRQTGFGAIIRYFSRQGSLDVSADMLDVFVLEQRKQFEHGGFSEWKWRIVRRGSELLKHYAATGTVELADLRPWEPVLRKPRQSVELDKPTPEQLADPDDLFALIWHVKQELLKAGLTKQTVQHYTTEGMATILRRHTEQGLTHYSESLASDMVVEIRSKYEQLFVPRVSYQNLRKASFLLADMYRTGKIALSPIPKWGLREPSPEFSSLLRRFCDNASRTGILSEGTIKSAKSAIRSFLFELESRGFKSFDGITLAEVSASITHMAKRYTGGLHAAISSVRLFLRYLFENDFVSEDLNLAVPEMVARRKVFREGFAYDEIERLLNSPDRNTAIGKRDYAIMTLAAQTGLRAVDIVNLKRQNIHWRTNEIQIVQHKTGKPLTLPLQAESGNAIAEYLLHGRPACDLPFVFLCHPGVLRPINNRTASAIVTKHMKRAGVVSAIPRRGFHSFRRAFGTRLLENEIPLDLLQQLLGHSQMDSARPYLSVDERGLKSCSLSLVPLGEAGGQD